MANDIVSYYGVAADCGSYRFGANGKVWRCAYADGSSPAAVSIGTPVVLQTTNLYQLKAITPATEASLQFVGISPVAETEAKYIWFQVAGQCEALVDGDSLDVTAGHFVEVLNGGTALKEDAAAIDTTSIGISVDGNATTAALSTVILNGRPVEVKNS
jgi:hypothetical protein